MGGEIEKRYKVGIGDERLKLGKEVMKMEGRYRRGIKREWKMKQSQDENGEWRYRYKVGIGDEILKLSKRSGKRGWRESKVEA